MFIEDLEDRRMFSVVTSTAVTVRSPVIVAATAVPNRAVVQKPSANAELAKVVQNAIDPALIGGQLAERATTTRPGEQMVSLDPSTRPALGELAAASGPRSAVDALRGLQNLFSEFARSLDDWGDVISSATPAAKPDITSFIDAEIASLRSIYDFASGDRQSHVSSEPSALGINPSDEELAEFIRRQNSGASGDESKTDDEDDGGILDAIGDAWDAIGDFAETALGYGKEVVFTKFGPPGPWTTLLDAPAVVEKVTGDSTDLLNGVQGIAQSGDKDPRMPTDDQQPNPEGDVVLNPQEQKAMNQILAFFGAALEATGMRFQELRNSVAQPVPGEDGSAAPRPDRDTLTSGIVPPAPDLSPLINPGSGEDGIDFTPVPIGTPIPTRISPVKDPPKPGSDVRPAPSTPSTPPPGGSPTNPSNP